MQNLRASKSATHGFASKSDTRHNRKGYAIGIPFSVGWASPTDLNRSDALRASDRLVQVKRKIRLSFGTSNGSYIRPISL